MSSISDPSVIIQSSSQQVFLPPSWFGEVVLIVTHLRRPAAPTSLLVRIAPHTLILTDSTGCATRKEERCL